MLVNEVDYVTSYSKQDIQVLEIEIHVTLVCIWIRSLAVN